MKKKEFNMLQLFGFDNNNYCDFTSTVAKAVAGKDILLCIWNMEGTDLLAISGQQGLTINRSADSIVITSKDTQGGWKSYLAGMKEWSIDNDGLYVPSDQSHKILSQAFENGDPVCIKVVDGKRKVGMFGGLAVVTNYPIEAPHDDAVTYSITLSGMGALVDLAVDPVTPDEMPEGTASLESLTVVSVPGETTGGTNIYVNPVKGSGNQYFYKTGEAPLSYPSYGETISATSWDGEEELTGLTAGNQIMVIEADSSGKVLKAGIARVTTKTA